MSKDFYPKIEYLYQGNVIRKEVVFDSSRQHAVCFVLYLSVNY